MKYRQNRKEMKVVCCNISRRDIRVVIGVCVLYFAGDQNAALSAKVIAAKERLHRARRQRNESFIREVFDRHVTKTVDCPDGELRDEQLEAALRDLGVSRDSKTSLFADRDSRVDYEKWTAALAIPSPVEAWARRVPWWQTVADAMPSQVGADEDRLRAVSRLTEEDLDAVCTVVAEEVCRELREQILNLSLAFEQLDRRKEDIDAGGASKFQTYKANAGNVDDFHKGLGSRIGTNDHPRHTPFLLLQYDPSVLGQARLTPNSLRRCKQSTARKQGPITSSRRQTTTSLRLLRKSGGSLSRGPNAPSRI